MESFAGKRIASQTEDLHDQTDTRAPALPLTTVRPGERAIVVKLLGGSQFRTRLVSMGIVPGREIEVLSGRTRHPYLVRVGASRVMIGWGMIDRVLVRRSEQDLEKP